MIRIFLLVAAIALCPSAIAGSDYQAIDGEPILVFERVNSLAMHDATGPLLRIYADGLVRVTRRAGRPGAQDYLMRLNSEALASLVRYFDHSGLLVFDAHSVAGKRAALLAHVDDAVPVGNRVARVNTTIHLQFRAYRGFELRRSLTLADAMVDAQRMPALTEIQNFAAAERHLLALSNHPDLRPAAEVALAVE